MDEHPVEGLRAVLRGVQAEAEHGAEEAASLGDAEGDGAVEAQARQERIAHRWLLEVGRHLAQGEHPHADHRCPVGRVDDVVDASGLESRVERDMLRARHVAPRSLLREPPGPTRKLGGLTVLVVADQQPSVGFVQVKGGVGPVHAVREEAGPLAPVRPELHHHLSGDRAPALLRDRGIEAEADLRKHIPLPSQGRDGEAVTEEEAVARGHLARVCRERAVEPGGQRAAPVHDVHDHGAVGAGTVSG